MTEPVEIKVEIPGRPYSVWVGAAILERTSALLPLPERVELALIAADAYADAALVRRARAGLEATCARVETEEIAGGEAAKTMTRAEALHRTLARAGAHRGDLVVALGGGSVGDLAGFVAATYHRGIDLVQMPTTVLAMVDASIGGKTAVNIPEGKNLVGAFHQPLGVVADVQTLSTLPDAEFSSGLAEVAKHGFIDDIGILSQLRDPGVGARDDAALVGLIARAAAVKARIVADDETELGDRAFLNYGHTLGHALESLGDYTRWRHGEAVAIGMMFAAHLAARLGYRDRTAEHAGVLEACGLPLRGADRPFEEVLDAMRRDKKYRSGIRFVVLEDLGAPVLVPDAPEDVMRIAYEEVRA